MVNASGFNTSDRRSFPGEGNMYLLFNSDIMNLLLKTNGERNRRPNFVIFVVWSTLIVGGWVLVAWSLKSCLGPAEIASFVFLVLFKDGGYLQRFI